MPSIARIINPKRVKGSARLLIRISGRLYDLRKAGCEIRCDLDHKTGVATYTLTHEPGDLR